MPWNKVTQMEELNRFVILAQTDQFTLTDLCEQFGISRKTGHKHLARYAKSGMKGLAPRSHRPHQFPQRTEGRSKRGRSKRVRTIKTGQALHFVVGSSWFVLSI